jgi:hypothetical protein
MADDPATLALHMLSMLRRIETTVGELSVDVREAP